METNWSILKNQIHPGLLQSIKNIGFKEMTPVQAATIPQMLNYKDVATEAVTGSGKTLSFLIPTIQIMLRKEGGWKKTEIGSIILSPTRELAIQIQQVLEKLLESTGFGLKVILFIGGTPIKEDFDKFNNDGGNIIIATPGRLEDLLLRREDSRLAVAVKSLEVLILDEADCLLNLGFEESINRILSILPKQRRTGLFSATQTTDVLKLIRAGLRNPVSVVVRDSAENQKRTPATLENFYYVSAPEKKLEFLLNFIRAHSESKLLVFFSTCASVQYFSFVVKSLLKNVSLSFIHGKMKEKARMGVVQKFREAKSGLLCATDVLSRGIDIEKIDWVLQFDPPSHPSSFIHRAGRTARNGEAGKALLVLQTSEANYTQFITINQKVEDIAPYSIPPDFNHFQADKIFSKVKKLQLGDRAVYDSAMRAFVSYFKSYSKYECSFILRTKDLELGKIAKCFCLLKFPKMSELWAKVPEDFQEQEFDLNSLSYKDKLREASRKRKLEEFQTSGKWPSKTATAAALKRKKLQGKNSAEGDSWSLSKRRKERRKERREAKGGEGSSGGLSLAEMDAFEKSGWFASLNKNKGESVW